jgi:E3 ubiquitin-protein ligase NEDD4
MKRVEEQFDDLPEVLDNLVLLLVAAVVGVLLPVFDINVGNTTNGYQEQDEVIQNFWKIVRTWDAEQKSRLLQFTTGQ